MCQFELFPQRFDMLDDGKVDGIPKSLLEECIEKRKLEDFR